MTKSKKVKVTVADGYTGLHQAGKEVEPGATIEVTERQKEFLEAQGALAPEKRSSRKKTKPTDSSDEPDDESTED